MQTKLTIRHMTANISQPTGVLSLKIGDITIFVTQTFQSFCSEATGIIWQNFLFYIEGIIDTYIGKRTTFKCKWRIGTLMELFIWFSSYYIHLLCLSAYKTVFHMVLNNWFHAFFSPWSWFVSSNNLNNWTNDKWILQEIFSLSCS